MKQQFLFILFALGAAVSACLPSFWAKPVCFLCIAVLLFLGLSALHDSCTDALTGLQNRRGLERFRSTFRKDDPITLLYLDVNDLHTVNRTRGHAAGDQLLQELAADLAAIPHAQAFRIGGDEFLLLRRGQNPDGLLSLWAAVSASGTVSAGAAAGTAGSWEQLLKDAEQAMYRQKEDL